MSSRAFTLVELLVVIAIIMLLLALILPVIKSARIAAKTAVCISNLRSVGIGLQAYTLDNRGSLPSNYYGPIPTWYCEVYENILKTPQTGSIYPYVLEMKVYYCPLDQTGNGRLSYSSPTILRNKPYGLMEERDSVIYLVHESAEFNMNNGHLEGGFANTDRCSNVHGGRAVILYCDWHAQAEYRDPDFEAKDIYVEPFGWNDT